jgi:hypothetical protein
MAYYLNIDRFGNEQLNIGVNHSVSAHSPASVAIGNNIQTNILNYGTTVVNTIGGSWSAANGTFTCTRAGNYQVYGQLEWASATWGASSIIATLLTKNGTAFTGSREFFQAGHTSGHQSLCASGIVTLAVGDVVRMAVLQVTGGSKTINATLYSNFSIHEI